jgi:purine-binding chemotaxis protein CheW
MPPFDASDGGELEVIVFRVAGQSYAIESRYAREVHLLKDLTPVPCTPAFFLGVINVRGRFCPVIELRRFLGLPASGLINASHALVLRDEHMEFALAVDAVAGIRSARANALEPWQDGATAGAADFLRGVAPDRTLVLDAGRILAHPGIAVHETVPG